MCDKVTTEFQERDRAINNARTDREAQLKNAEYRYGEKVVTGANVDPSRMTVGEFLEGRIKRLYRQMEAMERLKGSMSQDILRSPYSTISALMEP